ncbi:MAG: hypothetical protein OWQ52_12855 [Metallosphaera prunae]|uniref:hypothetical protein n=1 Tax=Metallosphaera prunae TaxID=47304 RepID=UPI00227664BC|nr:hypothetical protein [Metallosphaera prunae]MCY0863297.1 hypothetical protein [Metallosphaera prunae]
MQSILHLGARKVIALEPYPYSFRFAERNIRENKLDDKIVLLNAEMVRIMK